MKAYKKKAILCLFTIVGGLSTIFAQSDTTTYLTKVKTEVDSIFIVAQNDTSDTFMDSRDGSFYKWVKIGNQIWMAENLKATKYTDGTAIEFVTGDKNWEDLTSKSKAYCWYRDSEDFKKIYGVLYTWAAAMNGEESSSANPSGVQGVCPVGWHLPSDSEWKQMEQYLADNGYKYDGTIGGNISKLDKSLASNSGWIQSSKKGSAGNTDYPTYQNKSGFNALPGGYREHLKAIMMFNGVGSGGYWWTSKEGSTTGAWLHLVGPTHGFGHRYGAHKSCGVSVRCVKD